jgi:hypothetical protein
MDVVLTRSSLGNGLREREQITAPRIPAAAECGRVNFTSAQEYGNMTVRCQLIFVTNLFRYRGCNEFRSA